MAQRQITVLKVERTKAAKGSYFVTELSYRSDDGKTKGMKIYPFDAQKEVAEAFASATNGDVYEVEFQKNDRDFWEFKPVPVKLTGGAAVPAMSKKEQWIPDSDRQRLIVRQSSLSTAVAYLAMIGNIQAQPEDVVIVAKQFEDYVFSVKQGDVE